MLQGGLRWGLHRVGPQGTKEASQGLLQPISMPMHDDVMHDGHLLDMAKPVGCGRHLGELSCAGPQLLAASMQRMGVTNGLIGLQSARHQPCMAPQSSSSLCTPRPEPAVTAGVHSLTGMSGSILHSPHASCKTPQPHAQSRLMSTMLRPKCGACVDCWGAGSGNEGWNSLQPSYALSGPGILPAGSAPCPPQLVPLSVLLSGSRA